MTSASSKASFSLLNFVISALFSLNSKSTLTFLDFILLHFLGDDTKTFSSSSDFVLLLLQLLQSIHGVRFSASRFKSHHSKLFLLSHCQLRYVLYFSGRLLNGRSNFKCDFRSFLDLGRLCLSGLLLLHGCSGLHFFLNRDLF